MKSTSNSFLITAFLAILFGCGVKKTAVKEGLLLTEIEKFAQDSIFKHAHLGFALLDEQTGKYIQEYNADKYFIPASNTKLFTTYASLKYLGDSLPGFYQRETKDTLYLKPNADPTFLNKDFKEQKVLDKILSTSKIVVIEKVPATGITRLGNGWAWSNYQSHEMVERSVMPLYGNLVRFKVSGDTVIASPKYFQKEVKMIAAINGKKAMVNRFMDDNTFTVSAANTEVLIRPFTHKADSDLAYKLLQDTLSLRNKHITIIENQKRAIDFWKPFYTHKTEDVLRPMMHNSDNFLAEQLLIMAGSQMNGQLNERLAISELNKGELSKLSAPFIWYDGSGLSRYNNVTPRALTELLLKMKKEFGWQKVAAVLPSGNQGTLTGYYKGYENNIYSKGGRLGSTSLSLTGYLLTKKGNSYLFSFQTNNHAGNPELIRRAYEKYLTNIIEQQ